MQHGMEVSGGGVSGVTNTKGRGEGGDTNTRIVGGGKPNKEVGHRLPEIMRGGRVIPGVIHGSRGDAS